MKKIFISLFISGMSLFIIAQQDPGNNDKSKVLIYTLPDPMVFNEDSKVATKKDCNKRRNEIYKMFSKDIYGIIPGKMENLMSLLFHEGKYSRRNGYS